MRQLFSSRIGSALLAPVLLTPLAVCGPHVAGPSSRVEPAMGPRDCVLSAPAAAPGTVTVALPERVDPRHAPRPRNRAEAIIFHHLYESLLQIDCRGRVRPGLADSWASEAGGRRWRFFLRADARFWDGRSVTADDVRSAWELYGGTSWLASIGTPPTIRTVGERELVVEWLEPRPRGARLFAGPALAVLRPSAVSAWPVGTGTHRPEWPGRAAGGDGAEIDLQGRAAEASDRTTIRFRIGAGHDGRDLLDQGADILVTGDRGTIEYASALGDRVLIPLAWDRTHGLWIPQARPVTREPGEGRKGRRDARWMDALREALARDAVPSEARPASDDARRPGGPACDRLPMPASVPVEGREGPSGSGDRSARRAETGTIAYRHGDEVGRAVAGRLVALLGTAGSVETEARAGLLDLMAAGDGPISVRALPDSADPFAVAEAGPGHLAYVVSITPWSFQPCRSALVSGPGGLWLPLIETRDRVIVREPRLPLRFGAWGSFRVGDRLPGGGDP